MAQFSNVIYLDDETAIGTLMPFQNQTNCRHKFNRAELLTIQQKINGLNWFFQTDELKLDLGEPYQKISPTIFRLKEKWSIQDVFNYWETHQIQIDCLIMLNIVLLYYLKDFIFNHNLEAMRLAMNIDISCGLMNTGLHDLVGAIQTITYPLTNLISQKQLVAQIPSGCYSYIRGSLGWYDWIYSRSKNDLTKIESVYQGENVISIGNSEFLAFSRDYRLNWPQSDQATKFPRPQLVIKSFDYILDELHKNGYRELNQVYPEDDVISFVSQELLKTESKFAVAGLEFCQHLGIL